MALLAQLLAESRTIMNYGEETAGTPEIKALADKIIDLCMDSDLTPDQCIKMFMGLASILGQTMAKLDLDGTGTQHIQVIDMEVSGKDAVELIKALQEMQKVHSDED